MSCIAGDFMLSMKFTSEQEALQYIDDNKNRFLAELEEQEIKAIYTNGNTHIKITKNGKRLVKLISRFDSNKRLLDICKDIKKLKL